VLSFVATLSFTLTAISFLPQPLRAQFGLFGIPQPVIDITANATLTAISGTTITTLAKLVLELTEIIGVHSDTTNILTQAVYMAQRFPAPLRLPWGSTASLSTIDATLNRYGETALWQILMNQIPLIAGQAWPTATVAIHPLSFIAADPIGDSSPLAALATVETIDGSATKCLSTVSQFRQDQIVNNLAIFSLAGIQMDDTDGTNAEINQLNMLNAASTQANNQATGQGTLDACLVEQQVLSNKLARDNIADNLNFNAQTAQDIADPTNSWDGVTQFAAPFIP
jgi:hypothetical protein